MRKAALSLITTAAIMMTAKPVTAEIAWQENLRSAHSQAEQEGKLLLLHFYSDNCVWCERLEEGSFKAVPVGDAVARNFIPVKIHAGNNPKLTQMFKVTKFPTDVIVTTKGQTLAHSVSPQDPERYVAMLTETLPGLNSDPPMIATKPEANVEPAGAKIALAPSTPKIAADNVPDYAQSPTAPVAPTQSKPQPRGMNLPSGATGQLAGTRTEGLTLEMPTQVTAEITPPEIVLPTITPPAAEIAVPAEAQSPAIAAIKPAARSASVAGEAQLAKEPELAMEGFCPVTVIQEDRWVEGNPRFGVVHLGKLYLFASAEAMQTFLVDPVPFTPVLNEIDVVRFFEERRIVPGKRDWGLKDPTYNRMFFFADEAAMNHFWNEHERYTGAAIEVMEKAVKDANPGT